MKPPYIRITARCERHGVFQLARKPNKRVDTDNSRVRLGFYDAVKCPKCPWWADIVSQVIVAGEPAETPSNASPSLPGMEGWI